MGIEWIGVFQSSPPFTPLVNLAIESSAVRHVSVLATVFESPGWAAVIEEERTKLELKSGRHMYCIERDGLFSLVAVVADGYPTRLIFSGSSAAVPRLMSALREAVRAAHKSGSSSADAPRNVKKNLKPTALRAIADRFADVETTDKVAAAARKVNELKQSMHATLLKATERDTLLENLDDKARTIGAAAKVMFDSSNSMRSKFCCFYYRWFFFVLFLILIILLVIVLTLNCEQRETIGRL